MRWGAVGSGGVCKRRNERRYARVRSQEAPRRGGGAMRRETCRNVVAQVFCVDRGQMQRGAGARGGAVVVVVVVVGE